MIFKLGFNLFSHNSLRMENELIYVPVLDLLGYSGHDYVINRGVIDGEEVWVLENEKKEAIAYQGIEEGKEPFEDVSCLVEKQEGREEPKFVILAFLMGATKKPTN